MTLYRNEELVEAVSDKICEIYGRYPDFLGKNKIRDTWVFRVDFSETGSQYEWQFFCLETYSDHEIITILTESHAVIEIFRPPGQKDNQERQ